MQWQDRAIILKSKTFGESSLIVSVLSEFHGLHKGILKKPYITQGDVVNALWTARLPEQLGQWRFDCEYSYSPFVMRDAVRLQGLMVFCELLCVLLTERTSYPDIFEKSENFLESLKLENFKWINYYLLLEFFLLEKIGFGLDFSDTILATKDDPLTYVSPKTGRVVTRSKGEPYKDHLLKLPFFLFKESSESLENIKAMKEGFDFTEYFLLKNDLFSENHKAFYRARAMMIKNILTCYF